ncbi:MAG TPA: hypothetical protein VM054_05925 [bacterium]|nr:hypothetical protein [bacterium]
MKPLVVIAILAAAAAFAGETVSVGEIEPPTQYNAKWYLFRESEVRCDREGLNVYGSNDCASLWYMGQPINLSGYDGVLMSISYSQKTADAGDNCQLYLDYDDYHDILVHTFEDTDGPYGSLDLMLDDYYGVRDLKIVFVWRSNLIGVDEGFHLHIIEIRGVNWGEGKYTNIFTWDSPDDVTGHQSIDMSGMVGNMSCLAFEYGTKVDPQGWWAIDNVEVIAEGKSILPLQAGGYGVEDFSSGGWYQDLHGRPGEWEIDTDHVTGDMSGENWQCNSDAHPGSPYRAETLSPWFSVQGLANKGTVFDTWFSPMDTGDYASFGFYKAIGDLIFLDDFKDLHDWYIGESGDDVAETSWGAIKAGF